MSKTFDVIMENTNFLKNMSRELGEIAWAFETTGNSKVADKLGNIAENMYRISEDIHKAYSEENSVRINQSLQNSQAFIGSVLTQLLEDKDPKDAVINSFEHQFDTSLIDARENS